MIIFTHSGNFYSKFKCIKMESNLISRWCRICSKETSTGIFIFSEEAVELFLQAKIKKYLYMTITAEDKLPKIICNECLRKLDGFHTFATMALKNQERMAKFLITHNNGASIKNNENEQKFAKNKSLLHTYLTKGVKEKELQDAEVTEVEVRIDPMAILQCSLEEDGDEESENDHNEDNGSSDSDNLVIEQSDQELENCNQFRKPYQCVVCPRSFTYEIALQNHSWSHFSPHKRVLNVYNNCSDKEEGESETEQTNASNKITDREEEEEEEMFPCPICGKDISGRTNLQVHLETHRPKGKFGCDICGRIFKTLCNLHRHKEYHGGTQYPCAVCGRVYPTNSTLRAHSITHSDLRPHKCPLCVKTFKRNQDLKFHINQHTGARPYQCPYCPKAFASSGNCFSHRKRMHPLEVERDRERAAKIMR